MMPLGEAVGPTARFNEAAADDRGKLEGRVIVLEDGLVASMRPRPMTAENLISVASSTSRRMLQ